MRYEAEYSTLMDLFFQLVESQNGRDLEAGQEWRNDAQVLAVKLFRHLASMRYLAGGATVRAPDDQEIPFVDHASVHVLARAALETYLVFFYIFGTNDLELSHFRHKTWHLGGLMDRQRYNVFSDEAREICALERNVIERLKSEIEESAHFHEFSRRQRHDLLAGNWRVGSAWRDLGVQAGFHEAYFRNIFNYLCGHSHSSYASTLQLGQAQTLEDQVMLTESTISIGVVIMAHFSFTYPRVFSDADPVLASNPASRAMAALWRFGHEDMIHIFGD